MPRKAAVLEPPDGSRKARAAKRRRSTPGDPLGAAAVTIADRWKDLTPLFEEMLSSRPSLPPDRSNAPIKQFDPMMALTIAWVHLAWSGVRAREAYAQLPTAERLRKHAGALQELLNAPDIPPSVRSHLQAAMLDLRALESCQTSREESRALRKTCFPLSLLVTDLMTWLFRCAPIAGYRDGQLYEYGRRIVTAVTTPTCPACGCSHFYPNPRTFRNRDRQGDRPHKDREFLFVWEFLASLARNAPVADAAEGRRLDDSFDAAFPTLTAALKLREDTT